VVVVRFEGNVGATATCPFTRLLQGDNFGVSKVVFDVSSLTDDISLTIDDHTADKRIWRYKADAVAGKLERPNGMADVGFGVFGQLRLRFQTNFQY